jgi:hypothetical protein
VSSSNRPIPANAAQENSKRRDSAIPPYNDSSSSAAEKKPVPAKKSAPLKSLGALDALLRKS